MFESVEGALKFTTELRAGQLAHLYAFLNDEELSFELNTTFTGLQWDGSEYESLVGDINTLVLHMRESMPEFGLTGRLRVQDDSVWLLEVNDDGFVCRKDIPQDPVVVCPHCNTSFILEPQKADADG